MIRRFIAAGALALAAVLTHAHAQTVLFSQPSYTDGIAPHFSSAGQAKPWNPIGIWYLHANQVPASPYAPATWDVGALTGLECPSPGAQQVSVGAQPGHSAAQVCGGSMGAYLFSPDLPQGSPGMRMMIAPEITFSPAAKPFPAATSVLSVALDLQVPTATDTVIKGTKPSSSNCYAKLDLLFIDTTSLDQKGRMSLSVGIFGLGTTPKADGGGYDQLTGTAIADAWTLPLSSLVTLAAGSAQFHGAPWTGLQHFAFTVSQAQFAQAITFARQGAAGAFRLSGNPADYQLAGAHLNAELHYTPTMPTTLGWSMSGLTIAQVQ